MKNHMQHLLEAQQCCFVLHVADAEPDLASPGVRLMLVEYNYSLNLIMLHAAKSMYNYSLNLIMLHAAKSMHNYSLNLIMLHTTKSV
jgi:hypothetical protein